MAFSEYILYMSTATVSGLASLFMILLIYQKTTNLNKNLVSQALILYGCFDILGACSWYLGNKYNTEYDICATQEYIFQAANLFKAMTTVIISYLACYVVKELKPPQLDMNFLKLFGFAYCTPVIFVSLSIYFKSSSPFCGTSNSDQNNLAYVGVFLPPLYICVAINFWLYRVIKERTKHIVQFFSVVYQTSSANVDAQLLMIVNKLRIYPTVFGFSWLPEVIYIVILIIGDKRIRWIGIISGLCINSTGTLVAMCYFYQQYIKIYPPPRLSVDQQRDRVISDQNASQPSCQTTSTQNPIVISVVDTPNPQTSSRNDEV